MQRNRGLLMETLFRISSALQTTASHPNQPHVQAQRLPSLGISEFWAISTRHVLLQLGRSGPPMHAFGGPDIAASPFDLDINISVSGQTEDEEGRCLHSLGGNIPVPETSRPACIRHARIPRHKGTHPVIDVCLPSAVVSRRRSPSRLEQAVVPPLQALNCKAPAAFQASRTPSSLWA